MLTTKYDLTGVRGDTFMRDLPLERSGVPITDEDAQALAAQFSVRRLEVRRTADDPDLLTTGFVDILLGPPRVHLEIPAAELEGLTKVTFDVQFTDPRPGNPRGPFVWTFAIATLKLTKDVTRD